MPVMIILFHGLPCRPLKVANLFKSMQKDKEAIAQVALDRY